MSGQLDAEAVSYAQERTQAHIVYEVWQASELVWLFVRRGKSLVPAGIRTPVCLSHSLVTKLTVLPWLLIIGCQSLLISVNCC
jgi:hypothetical protein